MSKLKHNIKKTIEGILAFVRNSKDLDRVMVALSEEDASELLKLAMNNQLKGSEHRVVKVTKDIDRWCFYCERFPK